MAHNLNLDTLNAKVLNKSVTLQLLNLVYGISRHLAELAQLVINDAVIFKELCSVATED